MSVIVDVLKSKWFGALCYTSFAVLAGFYVYDRFLDTDSPEYQTHMSCFVFNDLNRNGVYDLGDRPYTGVEVVLTTPKGRRHTTQSNLSGFANFDMVYRNRKAPIRAEGEYSITATPGNGWRITTGNAAQSTQISRFAGSPTGLVASATYSHVGVAQELTASGALAPSFIETLDTLEAIDPSGSTHPVDWSSEGRFHFEVSAGPWKLAARKKGGGKPVIRSFEVRNYPVVLSTLAEQPATPASKARRETIGFDDLIHTDYIREIPVGYQGLDWSNWVATHHSFYSQESHVNATVSGEYMAYNSAGHPATIASSDPFNMEGLHISMAAPPGEKHRIVIKAWSGEQLVYEDRFYASESGPIYFDANYASVTRIEFSNEAYWHFVIDDLILHID